MGSCKSYFCKQELAALKAENERLMKALADMEAKKISLQDGALPKWINRAEAAERALQAVTEVMRRIRDYADKPHADRYVIRNMAEDALACRIVETPEG